MPTYEFECDDCKGRFSQVLHIDEQDKTKVQCPKCRSQRVTQLIAQTFVRASRKS